MIIVFLVSSVHFLIMIRAKNSIPTCMIKYNLRTEKRKLQRERKLLYKKIHQGKQLNARQLQKLEKIEEVEPILDRALATDPEKEIEPIHDQAQATDPEKEIEPIHDQAQATDPEKESYMKLRLQCDPLPFEIEEPTSSRHYKKEIRNNKVRFICMNSDEEYNYFEDEDWEERDEIANAFQYQERIKK